MADSDPFSFIIQQQISDSDEQFSSVLTFEREDLFPDDHSLIPGTIIEEEEEYHTPPEQILPSLSEEEQRNEKEKEGISFPKSIVNSEFKDDFNEVGAYSSSTEKRYVTVDDLLNGHDDTDLLTAGIKAGLKLPRPLFWPAGGYAKRKKLLFHLVYPTKQ